MQRKRINADKYKNLPSSTLSYQSLADIYKALRELSKIRIIKRHEKILKLLMLTYLFFVFECVFSIKSIIIMPNLEPKEFIFYCYFTTIRLVANLPSER